MNLVKHVVGTSPSRQNVELVKETPGHQRSLPTRQLRWVHGKENAAFNLMA